MCVLWKYHVFQLIKTAPSFCRSKKKFRKKIKSNNTNVTTDRAPSPTPATASWANTTVRPPATRTSARRTWGRRTTTKRKSTWWAKKAKATAAAAADHYLFLHRARACVYQIDIVRLLVSGSNLLQAEEAFLSSQNIYPYQRRRSNDNRPFSLLYARTWSSCANLGAVVPSTICLIRYLLSSVFPWSAQAKQDMPNSINLVSSHGSKYSLSCYLRVSVCVRGCASVCVCKRSLLLRIGVMSS